MSAARPARRPRRRWLLLLCLLLGLAGALEGAVRVRQWLRYGTTGSFYSFRTDPATGLRVPAPGVTRGRLSLIEVNSLGFRGPELELPKPEGRVRIAFLGGSTTFCAEATDNDATWPALVCAGLAQRFPQLSFDAVNAGAAAFRLRECLATLRLRVAPLQPDIVVIYEATNDLVSDSRALAVSQGLSFSDPNRRNWLEETSVAWQLISVNLAAWARRGRTESGLTDFDAAALAAGFRDRLAALVAEAQGIAPTVVLVTFAHRARRGMSAAELADASTTSLMWMPWMTAERVLAGFDAYNAAIREVGQQAGVVLVDGEDGIPGDDEHFADSVHLRDAGCRLQSERILAALADAPQLEWLAARAARTAASVGAPAAGSGAAPALPADTGRRRSTRQDDRRRLLVRMARSACRRPAARSLRGSTMDAAAPFLECSCCGCALTLPEGLAEGASFTCPRCGQIARNSASVRAFRWEAQDPYIRRNGVSRGNLWGGLLGCLAWLLVLGVVMLVRGRFDIGGFAVIAVPYLLVLVVLRLSRPGKPAMLWMMQLWAGLGIYCLYLAVLRMFRTDWTKVLETAGDISPTLLLALGGAWLGLGLGGTWMYRKHAGRLPQARERMAT